MRSITKTLSLSVDGKTLGLPADETGRFSGASLLRLMARLPEGGASVEALFSCLSDADLRSLMTVCLEHAEVMLPAGWMPVMTRGEWSWPELEHDTAVCLKLTMEEAVWTLEGFFHAGGSAFRTENPDM